MYIDVTETVKASILEKAVMDTLGGALSTGTSLIPGGKIVTGVISGLTSGLGDLLKKASNDTVLPVGSGHCQLIADDLLKAGKKEITLDLTSGDEDISQNWFIPGQRNPDGSPGEKGLTVLIPANSKNGTITLLFEAFPVT